MQQRYTTSNSSVLASELMANHNNEMRKQRNFTVGLEHETAAQIEAITHATGGSVGGFAKRWLTDLSALSPEQLRKLNELVRQWSQANVTETASFKL